MSADRKQPLADIGNGPAPDQNISHGEMATIRGQESVKRALEVAAAGRHHILLSGPPGSGKTLLAHTLLSILPSMTQEEFLELTTLYRASDLFPGVLLEPLQRPFRQPLPTITTSELLGDKEHLCPGEVSLAHRGVLLLDDLPTFDPQVVEGLCQPLSEGIVRIVNHQSMTTFPAQALLVATMQPCPCGWAHNPVHPCRCSRTALTRYQKHLSRRLLACFDLWIEVPRITYEYLDGTRRTETSAVIRTRVVAARARQEERFQGTTIHCNAEMGPAEISAFCKVEPAAQQLLKAAIQQLHLTTERTQRILRVARTIADLAGVEGVAVNHVAEAIWYCRAAGRDL